MGGKHAISWQNYEFRELNPPTLARYIYRKQLLELKPQEINLHGGPKPVQDTKRLNYGNMTLQRTTDMAHRAWAISQGINKNGSNQVNFID